MSGSTVSLQEHEHMTSCPDVKQSDEEPGVFLSRVYGSVSGLVIAVATRTYYRNTEELVFTL